MLEGALTGLVAAALGLGLAELVAGISANLRSPVLDVGNRVVDLVPGFLKDIAIQLFGTKDKIALLVGIAVMLALYAAALGIIARKFHIRYALLGVALFGVVGAAAASADRAGSVWYSPLPSLMGSVVTGLALVYLSAEFGCTQVKETPSSRRRFLAHAGAGLATAGILAAGGRMLNDRFNVAAVRDALGLPIPADPLPFATGVEAEGAVPFFTPNDDFYRIDTALAVPQVDPADWTLTVKGLVDEELVLTYDDLLNRRMEEFDITLTCVSNVVGGGLVGTARWLGVRLDDLLEEAGIQPGADQIVGRSVDGYTCGFPVSTLDGRDAIVAVGMNGEPLPLDHGFPARLVVPGLYGYVSATKWLSEIELTTFDAFDHYWVPRGYAAEAPIKLQSRIDTPRGLQKIDPGPFVIGGVAWHQTIGIESVEVKIDDGEWQAADMADAANDVTWRQWSFPWEATSGRHSITVRAKNKNGAIQTDERTEPLPNGATGLHKTVVLVN